MGTITRLSCFFVATSFFLLILQNLDHRLVLAENDKDLVFDPLEESNRHALNKRDAHLHGERSTHGQQHESWISGATKRIKRQFFDWINPFADKKDDTSKNEGQQQITGQQEQDNFANEIENVENNVPLLHHEVENPREPYKEVTDDEDLDDISGEGSAEPPPDVIPGQQVFYRITLAIQEPFVPSLANRTSFEFRKISQELTTAIDQLYEGLKGTQNSNVVKIQKREADSFSSQVTLDLVSVDFYDFGRLRNHLYSHIVNFHRLGDVGVLSDNFNFRQFEGQKPPPVCQSDEMPCQSGECVPVSSRCNGISECSDSSDEAGCDLDINVNEVDINPIPGPTRPVFAEPPTITPTRPAEDTPTITPTRPAEDTPTLPPTTPSIITTLPPQTEPTTLPTPVEPPITSPKTSRCRADDVTECRDGQTVICADQVCDGNKDCPGGDDEVNCTIACAQGEHSCDISRCIPLRSLCDGHFDCDDRTDELQCESQRCRDDQYQCIDGSCILGSQRCDGRVNCRDADDERDCSSVSQRCRDDQYQCIDGSCILDSQRCDGKVNCRDAEDERDCPPARCHAEREFTCNDGKCIPRASWCDRKYDCADSSDEKNCPCKSGDFRCANDFCIPPDQRCDGTRHCQDGSDEVNCTTSNTSSSCQYFQFRCYDGTCIDKILRCNKQPDCPDRSDEFDCSECAKEQFRCGDGSCIRLTLRCDGAKDCPDAEDEQQCATCQSNEKRCSNGVCVSFSKFCDGHRDCADGSDELNCNEPSSCSSTQFRCNSGDCIDIAYRCDSIPDCRDKSDELNCTAETCGEDEILCQDGTCIRGRKCDQIFDCADGSDERNCPTCGVDQFRCQTGGECIPEDYRCDGRPDCPDRSDELECVLHCPGENFRCEDGVCLDARRRCDGHPDCPDRSDELGCSDNITTTVGPTICDSSQFRCGDGSCISNEFRCDGLFDCGDESDEAGCPPKVECKPDEFDCGNSLCILDFQKCDGHNDCPDGIDEQNCKPQDRCPSTEHRCSDGTCLPSYLVCDGTPHCSDLSDESECGCGPQEFQCATGACVPGYLRCNRRPDCSDGSDEINCPTEAPSTKEPETEPPPTNPPTINCPWGQQPCRTGNQCVPYNAKCNGIYDCNDFSDEANCPNNSNNHGGCTSGYFRCENGPCIREELRCNGRVDCPRDTSDELDCPDDQGDKSGSGGGLDLKTYPSTQTIKESREVVFQCRDEGLQRAQVQWLRGNGLPLPPGTRDNNGRLEIPNIQIEHQGTYICAAIGYPPSTPGAQVQVHLTVEPYTLPPTRPPKVCGLQEATCANGDCIPKEFVCNGKYDCSDGSDETRCSEFGCEPNQFKCNNKQCVLKTWVCDGEKDCADGSDEGNCALGPSGGPCQSFEFACHSGNQCIPKSYHCDYQSDCIDSSDEVGCSAVTISKPPPPMAQLNVGDVFIISCTAVAVPTPEILWRLNWKHVPEKCTSTSINGVGTLTCPNIQKEDQGAYSCEALNIRGSVFASPDTILVVGGDEPICPRGTFNEEARTPDDCIECFCFGASTECSSADLFTYQLQPPFDSHVVVGIQIDPYSGVANVADGSIYKFGQPQVSPVGQNGVEIQLAPSYTELSQTNTFPYFKMPEHFQGNQLKSYGGYLKYRLKFEGYGRPLSNPDLILRGNGYTLFYIGKPHNPGREEQVAVRFFVGDWIKRTESAPETLATREEIMMALEDVEHLLIKLQYLEGYLNTSVTNIEMDSAAVRNTGLGQAIYVEQCACPVGYSGLSCENCAPGFQRHQSGPWLGQCYEEPEICPPGMYGDPSRRIPCQPCPCPLTTRSNQFASTCQLSEDGGVTCNCEQGYTGRRCQNCAPGYSGNPLIPGDYCKPSGPQCNPDGSTGSTSDGRCICKLNTDGPTCDQCKPNAFHLSRDNRDGCIACFCMGITQQCSSSNWYRDSIVSGFTNSVNQFSLVEYSNKGSPITDSLRIQDNALVYSDFSNQNQDVYYWALPPRFLGSKITSYGGNLRYSLRYEPTPGGQSSRNTAPDVELISKNEINLLYFGRDSLQPNANQTFSVPLFEQHWQRADGQKADREHLLMALADLKAILIKATYTTNTREASLVSVSLDTANERNTGRERALAVEQCACPAGYKGLSCENCDAGYTRAPEGIYLGLCEPCSCNGHSNECDATTGDCFNCRDHTTGPNCDQCQTGFVRDPVTGNCRWDSGECECNPYGSISRECINGVCRCKTNVEGIRCNQCRPGTFGLNATNPEGCQECFCSGITDQCGESNLYVEQIPSQLLDPYNHGFSLTDISQRERISTDFQIDIAENKIGYSFKPGRESDRWYWSLPSEFTGNQMRSYGGKLEFTQHYTAYRDDHRPDQDVVLIGNGITLFWTNPQAILPDRNNKVTVLLNTNANWNRLDYRQGPRPASREDILIVLANLNAILVRATLSSNTLTSSISDISLDTAVEQYTGKPKANSVEACRCPPGYEGTSCESCSRGYYRDINDLQRGPLGSCTRCPCSGNEEGCSLGFDNRVQCNCLPGYWGPSCQNSGGVSLKLIPYKATAPPGTDVQFTCEYNNREKLDFVIKGFGTSVRGRVVERYEFGERKSFIARVGKKPGIVQCLVKNMDNDVVGIITSRVYPGTTPTPEPPTEPPTPNPIIFVTIEGPLIKIVESGSTVRVNCSATSAQPNVPLRLTWKKDGGYLAPDHAIDDGSGLLVITDVRVSDSGTYICEATNGYVIVTEHTTITVDNGGNRPVAPTVSVNPSYVQVNEGWPIEVFYTIAGTPTPTINWVRLDGRLLNPQTSFANGVFRIPKAEKADEGVYELIVTNVAGTKVVSVTIHVSQYGGETMEVDIIPNRITANTGETFSLVCKAPVAVRNFNWYRIDNQPLPYNSGRSSDNSMLTVYDAKPEDSGVYICRTTSLLGLSGSANASVSVLTRTVEQFPTVVTRPKNQVVSQGSTTEIHCEASGSPPPTIKWTRIEEPLGAHVQQVGPVLRLHNVQVSDRGVYICVASNSAGIAQDSSIIDVERLETPIVEIQPSIHTVIRGGSLLMQCRSTAGIPDPNITWTRPDGRPLRSSAESLAGGVLRFTNIALEDAGEYICSAVNKAGKATAIGQIEVHTLPILTITPNSGQIVVREGTHLRLECKGSGIPQPNVHWEKHLATYNYQTQARSRPLFSAGPNTSHVAVHEITHVTADDQGYYICHGENAAGSAEERVSLTIESLPERGDITGEDGGSAVNTPYPTYLPPRPPFRDNEHIPTDKTFTAPVGTRAELRCQLDPQGSAEPLYVKWIRGDNSSLPENSNSIDGILYINDVQPSAAGEYRCLGVQSSGAIVFSFNAHLKVVSPPRITLEPPRQIVRPGDDAYVLCKATGDQPITVSWSAINRTLPRSAYTEDGQLQFRGIEVSDAGRYRCTAINSAGEADAVADVVVQGGDFGGSETLITAENRQQVATPDSTITLHCKVQGSGTVVWRREHLQLPSTAQTSGEYMRLVNVQPGDAGRYYCELQSESGTVSDWIDLSVQQQQYETTTIPIPLEPSVESSELDIQSSAPDYYVGDTIDLYCRSNEPGVITTWSKVSGRFADNVQTSGGTIRFLNVRTENSGLYRCEARGLYRTYHKDYNFVVIDPNLENVQGEQPVETKTAPQDSTVIMECRTDLAQPISYVWSKPGGVLPRDVEIYSRTITLNNVKEIDAGTYTCTASNGQTSIDIPTVLLVTGIVPYFAQAPNSYIALPTLPDPYIQFNFEISFRPEIENGLILYNGHRKALPRDDFISLELVKGVPEFRYNLGQSVTVVSADKPVELGKWHTIKVYRNRKKATMTVDDKGTFVGVAEGKFLGLDLTGHLYLGGVPDFKEISPDVQAKNGFVGCISRFKVIHTHLDIMNEALTKEGITTCETCTDSPCPNRGVCQEALTKEGYTCICAVGFSGPTCNKKNGDSCTPNVCGVGKCVDTDESFKCMCPIGRAGRYCEKEIAVYEPAFSKDAYIAYPAPKQQRRLKISLKFKPRDVSDGILLYCAENEEGQGNFVSLALKDGHVEFKFDIGSEPVIMRSEKRVGTGDWVAVTASKFLSEGRLIVNGDAPVIKRLGRNQKTLNLYTSLYVGGVDKNRITVNDDVGVDNSFNGCISDINVSGLDLHIIQSITDSANVEDCNQSGLQVTGDGITNTLPSNQISHTIDPRQTGCSSNPCRNDGQCYPISPTEYRCSCLTGYTGDNCEVPPELCTHLQPCQNGGTCNGTTSFYTCDCPVGFTGTNCEQRAEIRNEVNFKGNSYLELSSGLMNGDQDNEVIAFELSTNSSRGLIFWHGQQPTEDGQGKDYISLAVVDGFLEYSFDLGSGPAIIYNNQVKINDGQRHRVILKRRGNLGSIEIDNDYTVKGYSDGRSTTIDTNGNIYLGGTPNSSLMTGGRYLHGFDGCIHGFELQDSKMLDLGIKALYGVNVKPCSRPSENDVFIA